MGKVVPLRKDQQSGIPAAPAQPAPPLKRAGPGLLARGARMVLDGVWVLTILLSPLLKFVLTLDVLYQFVRMLYFWSTPGMHPGWVFTLHFSALAGLTFFIAFYTPACLQKSAARSQ